VKRLGEELKSLSPFLLSTDIPPKVSLASGSKHISFSSHLYQDKLYIMAVSTSEEEQKAEFIISGETDKVSVLFENRDVSIEGYSLKDSFPPIGVHVYRISLNP